MNDTTALARAAAVELVRKIAELNGEIVHSDSQVLISALVDDLAAASADALDAEARLVKIETQTRVLSEAVVAITEPSSAR